MLQTSGPQTPWFYSTDAKCETSVVGSGYTATQIGYIPTVKGGDFLRALRRCKSSTGDRTVYILNSSSCPSGRTVDAVLGYVR